MNLSIEVQGALIGFFGSIFVIFLLGVAFFYWKVQTKKQKEYEFIEKIGILLVRIIYIEGLMKDLLIFKEHSEYIHDMQSEELNQLRIEKITKTFQSSLIEEFCTKFDINENSKKQFDILLELRDVYSHCRIWKQSRTIQHVPLEHKFEQRKENLKLNGEGKVIELSNIDQDFIKFMSILDNIELFFKELSSNMKLDFEKIQ